MSNDNKISFNNNNKNFESNQNSVIIFCPWMTDRTKTKDGIIKLHYEILDFYEFIQLNDKEINVRNKTFEIINSLITEKFPNYTCQLYGSFKYGISLPTSDIDISVITNEKIIDNIALKNIYNYIYENKILEYSQYIMAKVPIIKCRIRESKIFVDISINNKKKDLTIYENIINKFPEIKPLILLIKYFLQQRALNDKYKGGINSYLLFNLLYYFLDDQKNKNIKNEKKEIKTLGHLLIEFFHFYGTFNYTKYTINTYENCYLINREGNSRAILSIKCIEDEKADMGVTLKDFNNIIYSFNYAYKSLCYYNSKITSYLSLIILPDDFLKKRCQK